MTSPTATLGIVGAGGSGRSVLALLRHMGRDAAVFYEEDAYFEARQQAKVMGLPVRPLSEFAPDRHSLLLSLGSGADRLRLAASLPPETDYASVAHPQAFFLEPMTLPPGAIIYNMTHISRNVSLGPHALIMTGTLIGHDTVIGAGFTTSGHVCIGGGARLGEAVYCGMHSAVRDGVSLADGVLLGMGAIVTKSIHAPGSYVGNPARKLEKR